MTGLASTFWLKFFLPDTRTAVLKDRDVMRSSTARCVRVPRLLTLIAGQKWHLQHQLTLSEAMFDYFLQHRVEAPRQKGGEALLCSRQLDKRHEKGR